MAPPPAPTAPAPRTRAGQLLCALEDHYQMHPDWRQSPWAWMKTVLPAQKGRIGEQLFTELCAAAALTTGPRTSPGHDLHVAARPIEVKLATLVITAGGDRTYTWLQLRPDDDYDLVALLAVDPDRVRLWLHDKHTVLAHTSGHHGGRTATETRKLHLDATDLPAWLGPDLADDPGRLHIRIAATP